LDASPRAYNNEAERRYHLRRLDDLLEALERLNLAEAKELPVVVKERIEKEGIAVEPETTFSRLIELVWAQQEKYLIDLKADRRKGSRRVGDGVYPRPFEPRRQTPQAFDRLAPLGSFVAAEFLLELLDAEEQLVDVAFATHQPGIHR